MKKSRLIRILRTFNKKEIRELRKWLQSPAHNQRKDVLHLFEYLFESNHLDKEKYLEKEKIYKLLFPNESFDDAKIRQVIHFLFKAVEGFLIYQELMEDEVRSEITLASVYRKRRLSKLCETALKNSETLHYKQEHRNAHFFRNDYLLRLEQYNYLAGSQRKEVNLQEVAHSLDATYFADKLQQSCFMLAHQAVSKKDYEQGLLEEILKHVEEKDFLKYPAIAVYYFGYKALTNRDEESYFYSLKEEIQEFGDAFPQEELRIIYLLAINYCISRVNTGKRSFYKEMLDLYKTGMKEQILFENERVTRWTFLNVVTTGLIIKEYEWIEQFIENYQQYLEEEHRENIVHYSLARLNFEKRNYKDAMRLLIQYDSDEIVMTLNAKLMLLKMYYELDELDALSSAIDSMRAYLKRKKGMGYHQTPFTNFIKLLKKLVNVNPFNREQKKSLRIEIQETNPLPDKNWLNEQLDQL